MDKKVKNGDSATDKKGGKAARVKRMRRGTKTSEVRETNSDLLYGEKDVK